MLLPVYFTRRNHRPRKTDANIGLLAAIEFDDPHDHFLTIFRLLERQHTHTTIVDAQNRKGLSEPARMCGTLKRDQRLIQPLRFPVSLVATPVTTMRHQAINDLVTSPVLRRLIRITRAWSNSRRAQQRQSQRLVIGFVRTVLAIGKDGNSKLSAAIHEIEPLMRRNFKLSLIVVATLNRADIPVVSRLIVCGSECKRRLEVRVRGFPIDHVAELDAIAR